MNFENGKIETLDGTWDPTAGGFYCNIKYIPDLNTPGKIINNFSADIADSTALKVSVRVSGRIASIIGTTYAYEPSKDAIMTFVWVILTGLPVTFA